MCGDVITCEGSKKSALEFVESKYYGPNKGIL